MWSAGDRVRVVRGGEFREVVGGGVPCPKAVTCVLNLTRQQ